MDLEGRFLGGDIALPEAGVVIEAILVAGGDGPMLTGRDQLFRGTLEGATPTVVEGVGVLVAADRPRSADESCAGTIHVILPEDPLAAMKAQAIVGATLGDTAVQAFGTACTMLAGTGSIGVECPQVALRRGGVASTGTLWIRLRWAGEPVASRTLPAWAAALRDGQVAGADETTRPSTALVGTIDLGGGQRAAFVADDEAYVAVEAVLGSRWYAATLPFEAPDGSSGRLSLQVADYAGDGRYEEHVRAEVVLRPVVERPTKSPAPTPAPITYLVTTGCPVDVAEDGSRVRLACRLAAEAAGETGQQPLDVVAEWTAAPLVEVGDAAMVTWQLAGGYVSSGTAVVWSPRTPTLDPSFRGIELPLVRLAGDPFAPELLRIRIFGVTGDGIYVGSAVEVVLDGVVVSSPNVRRPAAQRPAPPPPGVIRAVLAARTGPDDGPWTARFGSCTATLRDGGRSGEIACPGDPAWGLRDTSGSTTLVATWRPAP